MDELPEDDKFWSEVSGRVARSGRPALLLERWARGAGQRSWYLLADTADAVSAQKLVRGGSSLTVYLEPQLPIQGPWSELLAAGAKALLAELGPHDELVALVDRGSRPLLDAEYIADADELEAWRSEAKGRNVWISRYPEWPADGEDIVTRVVPDADGVARPHPY